MSEVYLVNDEQMQRHVAMKIVRTNETEFAERFARETRAMANLHHDHILPAYDYGEQEPWHYLVMPYIEHGTLSDLLKKGALSLDHAGILLQQVASGLQYAHEHGLIHRDIKPSNILLRDDRYAYLADFGLARTLEGSSDLTQTGTLLGTPEYMAPELADGPAGMSSDIYSLAVVLYQMITGRPPFQGNSAVSVFWKHLRDQPQPPSHLNPTLAPAIDGVLMRALAKDPAQRYPTPLALSQAYEDAVNAPDVMPSLYDTEMMEEIQPRPDLIKTPPTPVLIPPTTRKTSAEPGRVVLHNDPVVQTPPGMQHTPISPQSGLRMPAEPFPETPPLRPRRTPQPRPQEHRGRAIIALLIGLIFILLLVAGGLVALLTSKPHNSGTPAPTSTVQTGGTPAQSPTSPIQPSQLTSTAVSGTATAGTRGTATSISATAAAITNTTPLLTDPLNAPDSNDWPDNTSCTFINGSYHVLLNLASSLQPCISDKLNYNNVAIQVDVTLNTGDSAGLIFRSTGTGANSQFYDFEITNHGSFYFRYRADGAYTSLIPDTPASAIKSGTNTLLAMADGNDFKLFINGDFAGEVNNSVLGTGDIGLAAGTLTSSHADANFANLKIYASG